MAEPACKARLAPWRRLLLAALLASTHTLSGCITAIPQDSTDAPTLSQPANLPGSVEITLLLSSPPPEMAPGVCREALWLRDLWPSFVFNKDLVRRDALPLAVALNDTRQRIHQDAIQFHAAWLYGLNITFVEPGTPESLPVNFPDSPAPMGPSGQPYEGLVDHDQLVILYPDDGSVYRTHTRYDVKLWNPSHPDLVLLHELGHVLGLGHVSNLGNVMKDGDAELGVHDCSRWVLLHIHEPETGWALP